MKEQESMQKSNEGVADGVEADASTITPEAMLMETLELDSLDLVDIVVLSNKNFGVTVVGPDFVGIKTFQDFYNLIIKKVNE